jgi:hypothetical protein
LKNPFFWAMKIGEVPAQVFLAIFIGFLPLTLTQLINIKIASAITKKRVIFFILKYL